MELTPGAKTSAPVKPTSEMTVKEFRKMRKIKWKFNRKQRAAEAAENTGTEPSLESSNAEDADEEEQKGKGNNYFKGKKGKGKKRREKGQVWKRLTKGKERKELDLMEFELSKSKGFPSTELKGMEQQKLDPQRQRGVQGLLSPDEELCDRLHQAVAGARDFQSPVWRQKLSEVSDKTFNAACLGAAWLDAVQNAQCALGKFARKFESHCRTTLASVNGQVKDLLPLPLPSMPAEGEYKCFVANRAARRQHRTRWLEIERQYALEVWTHLSGLALNHQFIGELPEDRWSHSLELTEAQRCSLVEIRGHVDWFISDSHLRLGPLNREEELSRTAVSYDCQEVLKALPLKLDEIIEGLPPPGVAASVDIIPIVDDAVSDWLQDPYGHLLPEDEWPEAVPRAHTKKTEQVRI